MNTVPTPAPATAPELWHPTWCSPADCVAGQDRMSYHRSVATTVTAQLPGDASITTQLWGDADCPPEATDAATTLVVTFTEVGLLTSVHSYDLEAHRVMALLELLFGYRDVLGPIADRYPNGAAGGRTGIAP